MNKCVFCGGEVNTFIGYLNEKELYWCYYCKEETMNEDDTDAAWDQQEQDERRRKEEIDSDLEAFEKKFNNGRDWWFLIDQDENWIMKVTK